VKRLAFGVWARWLVRSLLPQEQNRPNQHRKFNWALQVHCHAVVSVAESVPGIFMLKLKFLPLAVLSLVVTVPSISPQLNLATAQALPLSAPRLALNPAQIATIAEQISVRIDGQAPGSGVLLARQGQTYYVLTAAHVVATPDEYDIVTPDGKKYKVNFAQVKKLPGVDLAVVPFTSALNYQLAKLGNSSQIQRGMPTFVAGWPTGGSAITSPTLIFQQGMVSANSQVQQADGYGLIYTNNTLPGMSGGPVLNSKGELIGIHGKGETERQQKTQNSDVVVKVGYNLGVPINTFLNLAERAGINLPAIIAARATAGPAASPNSPRRIDDFIAEGTNKVQQGDYAGALAAFDQAIAADANAADAHRLRSNARMTSIGWSFVAIKSPRNREVIAAALADIDRAIQLSPSTSEAWALRAAIRQVTDSKGAFADISEALRLSPNSAFPYIIRSNVNANERNWQATIADATQALKMDPNSPYAGWAYNSRGFALFNLKDYAGAVKDLTDAIRLNPKVAPIYINRGHARAQLGDLQGALNDMQKGADLAIEQNQPEMHAVAVRGMNYVRSLMR
jgi:tetratricopeptide (TPR) repeat protein